MLGWSPHTAPGVGSTYTAAFRKVFSSTMLDHYLAGGKSILGSIARDPGNGDPTVLRPGTLLGKNSSGYYGTSVIGTLTNAEVGTSTQYEMTAAAVTELVRRQGASGTFKITGPPTAAGTVRTVTATYSAASSTNITITAIGTADVWTLTAPNGTDGGFYQLEVTTGAGTSAESTQTTVALAANAVTATVDAALEALTNVGTGGVAAVYSDPTLTLTFISNLGPVQVRVLADTTNDGGVFEGGWAAVHTTTGVDGRFIAGSLIQPTDGTETILSFIPDGSGMRVVDIDGSTSIYAQNARLPVEGAISYAQLIPAATDTSLKAYIKAALKAVGDFRFQEDY